MERSWDGEPVDFVDGVMFSPTESYLTLGSWAEHGASQRLHRAADLLPLHPRARARLPDHAGLPLALGHRLVLVLRRVRRADTRWCGACGRGGWRRSDVYHRLVALEGRFDDRRRRLARWREQPPRERVVQDVEVPLERTARLPAVVSRRGGHDAGLAVSAALAAELAALPAGARADLRQRRVLGHGADPRGRARRRRQPARSSGPSPSSAATSRCTPTPSTTAGPSTCSTARRRTSPRSAGTTPNERLTGMYEKVVGTR